MKHAVTRPWTSNQFDPPADDFECVSGFAEASPTFNAIVESIKYASDVIVVQSIEDLDIRDTDRCQRVRYVAVL